VVIRAANRSQLAYWRWLLANYIAFAGAAAIVTFVLASLYVHPLATIFVLIVATAYYRRPKAKQPVGITIGQLSLR
jgi:Flp pilus assembly protein TadB